MEKLECEPLFPNPIMYSIGLVAGKFNIHFPPNTSVEISWMFSAYL
jgi:hypothetical protein